MIDLFSNSIIPIIILGIVIHGKIKGVDIYDSFVKGAIDGLKATWSILPYIIGIFLAIGIFKSGKGIDMLEFIFKPIAELFSIPKELIGLIIVKPLSGSGALGMYNELVSRVGMGNLVEQMGATIVGASETIFYTMAIYFGSLKIKNTRHTLACAMMSHVAGVLAAVFICYILFA
ncbi:MULTISPECIES: spore maturation protein [Paraclostridium]|jgi:spore maturation protein B|uniref:Spore maturation protein n=2 Tax=Paraclostridium bifermentans TaxID=1490 RepID=A0ABY8R4A4_PARBF|nr:MULTISPECIES: membrane protein [Paraclostridium]KGJ48399.1 spore maturation protein [Clostridium sp. NCR]MCU9807526.1 spore maturation protein [Paraclostridium sp. AKS46]EQK40868.1 putative membrane protein [[Clostridium] bifermentans ATCC 638] [Paraclostridium bifermentans ATCC 638 = DSM 14991]EQK44579.1 putative membrane protein [[Clostridium] bifermentans ATCC 19299] [Paraclostridium bifermentans ATCC 19299]MBZ6007007.1 spore maturation protein [Paraclostridium bifermentans]